jgi:hypothetical protein
VRFPMGDVGTTVLWVSSGAGGGRARTSEQVVSSGDVGAMLCG